MRFNPAVAQNVQSKLHPTCELTHAVMRFSVGINTDSTKAPSCNFTAFLMVPSFDCGLAEIRHFFKAVGTFLPKPLIHLLCSKGLFTVRFKEGDYSFLT